jgi:hypothetical protein
LARHVVWLGLVLALAGCSARHQAAGSAVAVADAVAALTPLAPCDTRTFSAGGADVTLIANLDGSLGSVRIQEADSALQAQILDSVTRRFGAAKRDPRVQSRPNKWGLNVLVDACGRPISP